MRPPALARIGCLAFVFTAAWLGSPPSAAACSCQIDPDTGEVLYPEAAVIFRGTVLGDAEPTSIDLGNGSSWQRYRFRVRVDRYFKGLAGRDIDVFTDDWAAHCGFPFQPGTSYLVYGDLDEDGRILVSACSATVPVSAAGQALSSLGEGRAPDRSQDVVRGGSSGGNGGCSSSASRASGGLPSGFGAALLLGLAALRRTLRGAR